MARDFLVTHTNYRGWHKCLRLPASAHISSLHDNCIATESLAFARFADHQSVRGGVLNRRQIRDYWAVARLKWNLCQKRCPGTWRSDISIVTVRWKGSEGSKQTKHTTRKLTSYWFQKCKFSENLPSPFFGNISFIKLGTFSALLALPVMIREECRQMAYQTIPNILLSNASVVTKSCIARFVEDDAFNLSALSDCSTGPSPPLVYSKSTLSSF